MRGTGSYRLRRISRVTTRSTTRFNGRAKTHVFPGSTVALALNVTPASSGPGVIVVERKDPIDGWQFLHRYRVQVVNGRAVVNFLPPSVGRYRASSIYLGSRVSSRSETKLVKLRVSGPLEDRLPPMRRLRCSLSCCSSSSALSGCTTSDKIKTEAKKGRAGQDRDQQGLR